jgi:hypothetical protein
MARTSQPAIASLWHVTLTQPGVGVPMVLVSGRLAAERVLGPDPAYRSRTWL